ncbi:MAG: LemA family protein [Desulfovibrionaceae bacterium]|nr:LemA family protein [Desulfovibrionaceae bacterium]
MNSWLILAAAVLAAAVLWYIMTMNRFARLLVKIREADSGIDVALTMRFDTLTKMLDVTKAYAKHEADTLGTIVTMRQGMSMTQRIEADSQMDTLHGKINVLAEAYPELRSSDNFKALQTSIGDVEEQLQAARRIYNMNVSQFNQMLVTWPDSIVGRMHGHVQQEFFRQEEPGKKQDVPMDFSSDSSSRQQ